MVELRADIDAVLDATGGEPRDVVAILQALQDRWGYLPEEALRYLGEVTPITPARIEGVSTFYARFRRSPAGRHTIRVCVGTACFVKGADNIVSAFRHTLKVPEDGDTDPEGLFTVERVACLGCCTLAPVVQIDNAIYGNLTRRKVPGVLADFLASRADDDEELAAGPAGRGAPGRGGRRGRGAVALCTCSSCRAAGALEVFQAFREEVRRFNLPVDVRRSGCSGLSYRAPVAELTLPDGATTRYAELAPGDVRELMLRHFRAPTPGSAMRRAAARLLDRLLAEGEDEGIRRTSLDLARGPDGAFWAPQVRIVTALGEAADPLDLDRYRAEGGFAALQHCLTRLAPPEVAALVRASGLRGRGGAGYPTGVKWEEVRGRGKRTPFVVCNADEGDPGAFMDRMTLESFPYRVIEGLAIAAYAVGAREGIVFVRSEYPLAIRRLRRALELCAARGILGARVLGLGAGLGFSFQIRVVESAGAFVCGEETALIAALEGVGVTPVPGRPTPRRAGCGAGRP